MKKAKKKEKRKSKKNHRTKNSSDEASAWFVTLAIVRGAMVRIEITKISL